MTTDPQALPSTVMVGRDTELAELVETLTADGGFAFVRGEAGIGKSRLVREALVHASGHILVGHCHQVSQPYPLGPVLEALRHSLSTVVPQEMSPAVGALAPLLPECAGALPPCPPTLRDPRAERHRVLRGVVDLLAALAPCVLVLEDLHWADDYTLDLLLVLSSEMPARTCVIGTYREEDLPAASPLRGLVGRSSGGIRLRRITLEPFDVNEVRRLVRGMLDTPGVSLEFARYLHSRTAGLPFAVEEVLRLLQDRVDLMRKGELWMRRSLESIEVPERIRDSILSRVGRLSELARSVLEAIAVIGRGASRELIVAVTGLDSRDAAIGLSEAAQAAFVCDDREGGWRFRHSLSSEAVHAAIPAPRCADLHRRVAEVLEDGSKADSATDLAHHYRLAGDVDRWVAAAEIAADHSVKLHDHAGACRILRTVMDEAELDPSTRASLGVKLVHAALHGLAHDEATALLADIVEDGELPPETRGHIRFYFAGLLFQAGDARAFRVQARRSLEELPAEDPLRARAMSFLAYPHSPDGALSEHRRWMEKAYREVAQVKDRSIGFAVATDRVSFLMDIGDPDALGDNALPSPASPAEEIELARGCTNLAEAAFRLGHHHRAAGFCARARRICDDAGYERFRDNIAIVESLLRWARGDWVGLIEDFASLARSTEHCPIMWSQARFGTTALSLATDRADDAVRNIDNALETTIDGGGIPTALSLLALRIRIRLARGQREQALEDASRAMDILRNKEVWVWAADPAPAVVEALLASDAADAATEFVEEFAAGIAARDAPAAQAAHEECLGLLLEANGGGAAGATHFDRAHDLYSRVPLVTHAARALELAGRCWSATDRGVALERFEAALGLVRPLGASYDVARIVRTMREAGFKVPRPWQGGRRGYGDRLSPREHEIAHLASLGHTNKEIAATLFLSPKTVGHHLERAMRKLEVHSRRELSHAGSLQVVRASRLRNASCQGPGVTERLPP